MNTEVLLIVGVVTAVVFVMIALIEGDLRPGYSPAYHAISELSLGDRGWIQIANFVQMGLGAEALAVGIHRNLESSVAAVLLAVFGLGSIAAGAFVTDPIRGLSLNRPSRQADLAPQGP